MADWWIECPQGRLFDVSGNRWTPSEGQDPAGPNLLADTVRQGDDVQVIVQGMGTLAVDTVVITPGRNGVLDSVPAVDVFNSEGPRIVAGLNGVAETTAADPEDVQVLPVGTFPLAPEAVVIAPGPDGVLDTVPVGAVKNYAPTVA